MNPAHVEGAPIEGVRYLQRIFPLLKRLRGRETQRDRAGNRRLEYPQYVSLILLSLFNPLLQSLRGLQQASELQKVQRLLKGPRASLGALSEAGHVFDPAVMQPLIEDKLARLNPSHRRLPGGETIPQQLLQRGERTNEEIRMPIIFWRNHFARFLLRRERPADALALLTSVRAMIMAGPRS